MQIDIITIFPDYLAPLGMSLLGKARQRGLVDLRVHDLREHTDDVHRTVDDAPFGGGPGMVMAPEPWARALQAVLDSGPATMPMVDTSARHTPARSAPTLIVPTPAGRRFDQVLAAELADEPWLAFACGRYEGIDARVAAWAADRMRVEEVSLGDYVLAGGEVAALVMIETVTRLLPGVVGNPESVVDDSHSTGLLEAPAYTRPASWRGYDVPPVLLSGDHAAVARWRAEQSRERTADRRPDLLPPTPRLSSTPGDVAD